MSVQRQPAGVPTGGQFASDPHAEADIDLAADARDEVVIDPPSQVPLRGLRGQDGEPLAGDPLLAAVVARTGLDRALTGAGRWVDLQRFAAAARATGLDVTDDETGKLVARVDAYDTQTPARGDSVAAAWRHAVAVVSRLRSEHLHDAGRGELDGGSVVEDPSWQPGAYYEGTEPTHPDAVERLLSEHDQWRLRRERLRAAADAGEGDYEELDDLDFNMGWLSDSLADQLARTSRR